MIKRNKGKNTDESASSNSEVDKDNTSSKGVKPNESIAKRASQMLARPDRQLTVDSLNDYLLKQFPASDAQDWDRTGMLVGEGALPVSNVAIALDPTVEAIREAARLKADVLVCHHPLFLDAPTDFHPAASAAVSSGAGVWAAIQNRIAVMSFHTALDVSKQAQMLLPNMLGLSFKKILSPLASSRMKGFGQICKVPLIDGHHQSLSQLSAKCLSVFGRAPRVWGDMSKPIDRCVTLGGSAGSFAADIIACGADAVICGEMRYHSSLELKEAGVAIIELGHDVSEFPLLAILAGCISDAGVDERNIVVIDQSDNWCYPESIRL